MTLAVPDQSYTSDADPYADVIKLASLAVPVVTYAIKDRDADVYAEKVKLTQWESDIIIRTPLGRLQVGTVTTRCDKQTQSPVPAVWSTVQGAMISLHILHLDPWDRSPSQTW